MPSQQELIKQIVSTLDSSVERFNTAMPGVQNRIANELEVLIKDLDIKNGRLVPSIKNLKTIAAIKARIGNIVRSPEYRELVKQFAKDFNTITALQNQYFSTMVGNFKQSAVLRELQKLSISSTIDSLTEAGITAKVVEPIQDILRKNITTGDSYSQLLKQVREYITTSDKGLGALERHAKQITTDSLNQYAAQYTDMVANDLGLEWFMYVGPIIENSRDFCRALIKKRYIHRSELANVIIGEFAEFKELKGKINPRTDLPSGMVPGTNVENFHVYRGGYQCGHQLQPVDEAAVPLHIRLRFPPSKKTIASRKIDRKDWERKLEKGYTKVVKTDTGGAYAIHKDADKSDLYINTQMARVLAESGDLVQILKHVYRDNVKNPEMRINGVIAEVKTPDAATFKTIANPIKKGVKRAVKVQGASHVVVNLTARYDKPQLLRGIKNAFEDVIGFGKTEKVIDIVYSDNSMVRITEQDYTNGRYIRRIDDTYVGP